MARPFPPSLLLMTIGLNSYIPRINSREFSVLSDAVCARGNLTSVIRVKVVLNFGGGGGGGPKFVRDPLEMGADLGGGG